MNIVIYIDENQFIYGVLYIIRLKVIFKGETIRLYDLLSKTITSAGFGWFKHAEIL